MVGLDELRDLLCRYVWFLDVMKQGIGSSFGHFANIFLSVIIADTLTDADECQWYGLTYVVDSTLGTAINLSLLRIFEHIVRKSPHCTRMNFGEYGNPPQLNIFFPQLCVWLTIVLLGKSMILFWMFQLINPLNTFISRLFRIFHDQPRLELVVVMIIIPTILNTVQFWVTDTFLKAHSHTSGTSSRSSGSSSISDYDLDEDLLSDNDEDLLSSHSGSERGYMYRASAPMKLLSYRTLRGSNYTKVDPVPEVELIDGLQRTESCSEDDDTAGTKPIQLQGNISGHSGVIAKSPIHPSVTMSLILPAAAKSNKDI